MDEINLDMNEFTNQELIYLRKLFQERVMEESRPRIELDILGKLKAMIDGRTASIKVIRDA